MLLLTQIISTETFMGQVSLTSLAYCCGCIITGSTRWYNKSVWDVGTVLHLVHGVRNIFWHTSYFWRYYLCYIVAFYRSATYVTEVEARSAVQRCSESPDLSKRSVQRCPESPDLSRCSVQRCSESPDLSRRLYRDVLSHPICRDVLYRDVLSHPICRDVLRRILNPKFHGCVTPKHHW
jgi:hypothetical protein